MVIDVGAVLSIIVVSDGVTMKNAASLCFQLTAAFRSEQSLVLNIDYNNGVDLCGLQLIQSARKSFEENGCDVKLSEPAHAWADIIICAGFVGDRQEDAKFWFHNGGVQ